MNKALIISRPAPAFSDTPLHATLYGTGPHQVTALYRLSSSGVRGPVIPPNIQDIPSSRSSPCWPESSYSRYSPRCPEQQSKQSYSWWASSGQWLVTEEDTTSSEWSLFRSTNSHQYSGFAFHSRVVATLPGHTAVSGWGISSSWPRLALSLSFGKRGPAHLS